MTPSTLDETVTGEWVTVKEAAVRLGMTERSVFRRLAKGVLQKKAADDGSVMVLLTNQDVPAEDMTGPQPASAATTDATNQLALHVMHSLFQGSETFRLELRERDEKIALLSEELGRLREQLAWQRMPFWRRLAGMTPS